MPARRFPPPWFVEELNDACFVPRVSLEMGGRTLPRFINIFFALPSGIRQTKISLKCVVTYADGSRRITGNGAAGSDISQIPTEIDWRKNRFFTNYTVGNMM
jgi:hypothetical protein